MQKKKQTPKATQKAPTLKAVYQAASKRAPSTPEPVHVEVIPAGSPSSGTDGLTAQDCARIDGVLGMVRQDINNAEIGKFFALRAGVGMIVVKEMCPHGEWSQAMLKMLPGRSPATLRRYMGAARDFLDSKALMARDIWDKLASVGSSALGAAAAGLLLGDGTDRQASTDPTVDVPDEVQAMAEYLREESRGPSGSGDKGHPPAPRALTAAEKRKAASDLWQGIAGRVTDEGIARQTWQVLDQETLETCASALRTVADKMMAAARKAKAGK